MSGPKTNIALITDCDAFPYPPSPAWKTRVASLVHLRVAAYPDLTLGYMLPSVAHALDNLPDWALDIDEADDEGRHRTLTLLAGNDSDTRSAAVQKTVLAMKATGHFRILDKWRGEEYAVYGPDARVLFRIERSASQLFGVVTYGVHLTAYQRKAIPPAESEEAAVEGEDEDDEEERLTARERRREREYEIWVPRRSATKQTFPAMLDNSVAGGLAAGEKPWGAMLRESEEEASLDRKVAREAREVGTVTYFYVSGENSGGEEGLLQPECQIVYDLDLTGKEITLKPNDDEVEGFELLNVAQVRDALAKGEFKPNCALVMLDFLIRHGFLTSRNEPYFLEIVARLHRNLEFPLATFVNDTRGPGATRLPK